MHYLRRSSAVLALALIILSACQTGGSTTPSASASGSGGGGGSKGTIKIGIDLPLSGGETTNGEPTANGVKLALKDAGGVAGGYTVELDIRDDAVNGVHNPDQGATNVQALVADDSVVGMVGPFNSNVARAEVPITSPAGLLQCSPANTATDITKKRADGTFLRGSNKVSYVRVATTDDVQGPAMADYMYNKVGAHTIFIVDDTETYGKGLADEFQKKFEELGGTVTGRQGVPNPDGSADYTSILTSAKGANPAGVFYGGVTTTGGAKLRSQMADAGMGDLPFGGGDGIVDGPGSSDGSFINLAGDAAANSYGSVAAIHDIPNADAFSTSYNAEFSKAPGAYSAPGYACAQVIIAAVNAVADQATSMADLREKVRAYVTEGGNSFDTVLGSLKFDENGDTSQHTISYYKADPNADGGANWVFDSQKDFGQGG